MEHPRTSFSRVQRQRFEERGLVKLEGLVPRRDCEAMADRIWGELSRKHAIRRNVPASWTVERPWGFKALQDSGAFEAMATPAFRAVIDDLMGRGRWVEPPAWGQPLVCFPRTDARAWDVPTKVWHLDLPADPRGRRELIGRLFLIVAPLKPRGGGTLVAAGSHRLVLRLAEASRSQQSSADMRKRLRAHHPWFAELMSADDGGPDRIAKFMDQATAVDGVACRVEEMTGEPGDVFVMHPASLHAPAPNAQDQPRLVLAQSIYPKGWSG